MEELLWESRESDVQASVPFPTPGQLSGPPALLRCFIACHWSRCTVWCHSLTVLFLPPGYTAVSLALGKSLTCGRHSMCTTGIGGWQWNSKLVTCTYSQQGRYGTWTQTFSLSSPAGTFWLLEWWVESGVCWSQWQKVFSESYPQVLWASSALKEILAARGGCDMVFLVIMANFYCRIFWFLINCLFGEHCLHHTYIQSFELPNPPSVLSGKGSEPCPKLSLIQPGKEES